MGWSFRRGATKQTIIDDCLKPWDYVEAPASDPMIAVRRGLPLSRQPFGVIALNRRLTSQERTEYQMEIA